MAVNTRLFDGVVIFTQVVDAGGFSAAAELTGHSTSYISKEINKLEARLGVRLLNRTTRSIGLTPEGKVYYQQCLQMVQDAEDAEGLVNQSDITPKGHLKLSCPVGFANQYLKGIIAKYMQTYPDVTVELDLNDRMVDVVQEGFDLSIRATQNLEESSLICRKVLASEGLTFATKSYLDKRGRPHHPHDLANHDCICYSNHKQPERWRFEDHDGTTISVDVKAKMLCNSGEMELAMVLADQGVCRLPAFYLQEVIANQQIELVLTDFPPHKVDVFVVYPSRKHLLPKVRCFIDMLVAELSQQNMLS
ncbi:LysR family transcriptional regulator [Catenovulum sp. SM1970]|uniref:LysR family transcriptional regulator n=1 Tax=Marinifaba aquimaris TaxID=2741323 RepID=UPI00157425CA|nr:LysR family transcriptional regulator [Marinifaba aquimaris]NTS75763.1 LysR family transcriptional regulator [Marinifaba aquimaris]